MEQLYATSSAETCVSIPPSKYPLDAGEHPIQPSRVSIRLSKPASNGPAMMELVGKEMVLQ
jgi:hypothetical protein